jgi:hypothetical protein
VNPVSPSSPYHLSLSPAIPLTFFLCQFSQRNKQNVERPKLTGAQPSPVASLLSVWTRPSVPIKRANSPRCPGPCRGHAVVQESPGPRRCPPLAATSPAASRNPSRGETVSQICSRSFDLDPRVRNRSLTRRGIPRSGASNLSLIRWFKTTIRPNRYRAITERHVAASG